MNFIAAIKEIKMVRKSNTIDVEYSIRFVTEDKQIMALAAIPSDETVQVSVEGKG